MANNQPLAETAQLMVSVQHQTNIPENPNDFRDACILFSNKEKNFSLPVYFKTCKRLDEIIKKIPKRKTLPVTVSTFFVTGSKSYCIQFTSNGQLESTHIHEKELVIRFAETFGLEIMTKQEL